MKRFQQSDMKNIVKASTKRQLQTISDRTVSLHNLIRSEETRRKLAEGRSPQRYRSPMMKTEPNPLPDLKFNAAMCFVIMFLHRVLSMKQSVSNFSNKFITFQELIIDGRKARNTGLISDQNWGITTIHNTERSSTKGLSDKNCNKILPKEANEAVPLVNPQTDNRDTCQLRD